MIGVISGPVKSGKSAELIKQAVGYDGKVLSFSHSTSQKHEGQQRIPTPWALMYPAQELPRSSMILVDDAHLFDYDLVYVCLKMSFDYDHRVMVAGLVQDWIGRPIPVTRDLIAVSDQVMKLYGKCSFCGSQFASKSILIADKGEDPVCLKCYKGRMELNNVEYVGQITPAELARMKSESRKSESEGPNLELISPVP